MLSLATISFIFTTISLCFLVLKIVIPPLNYPRTIPTIPFYVIFLPSIFNIDQVQLFDMYLRKPLEKYGAVKLFFGSRWNILVSNPEYLAQIFKDEDTFAKSGNQKKIPYSVIAAYTGDNVISAHGSTWKTYRSTISLGLQNFNNKPFYNNVKLFGDLIDKKLENKKKSILMNPLFQRLALDNISQTVLGFDFGTLKEEKNPLHERLINIKKQIFHPFFLTFPFFDKLPLPARRKGFEDVAKFREILVNRVKEQMVDNYNFEQTSFPASDLIRAFNSNLITNKQLTDNIVILLVAGHENPQLLLTTCFYLLAKHHSTWQKMIRKESEFVIESKTLEELPLLNSFIFEAVRMYPPLNTIINRKTSRICRLGKDIVIPEGTYVGYNNYGATHSKTYWGNSADVFDPARWGSDIEIIMKTWRQSKNRCALSSFHGGRRACLGEKLALTEVRITIVEMLKRYSITLPSTWEERMTPAGPLCPFNLELSFKTRDLELNY